VRSREIISYSVGAVLAVAAGIGFSGWYSEHQKVGELEKQMEMVRLQEMRSTVDRSVSKQMEEIANEQREISDEKREEALQQTRVANEMRQRSEIERLNAIEAEMNALASEKKAVEASTIAENERKIAEHQKIQAEMSKRVADTLSYIALGRSLGSISTIQYQAGNDEIANMLSYAAYLYTSRYNGDIFYPAVFQSLMESSRSVSSWSEHTGAIMSLQPMPNSDNKILSVSNYGEILISERQGNDLHVKTLFKDNHYDFRDVHIDKSSNNIYALSRSGHLVTIFSDLKTVKIIPLENALHPMRLHPYGERNLLIIGEQSISVFDMKRNILNTTKQLPFKVTLVERKSSLPLLFDDKGYMHLISGPDKFESKKLPVQGKVTAYCESKNTGVEAFGMSDGTIWLNLKGKFQKLVGHSSRISKMKLNGRRLYSTSYDGKVNLWVTDREKTEPMQLLSNGSWIMYFNFDSTKNTFWLGDIKGNLKAVNISVPLMLAEVKKRIKRNFTKEEWDYFIGQNVPYESLTDIAKKGD